MVDKLKTRDRNYKFELPNYKIYRFNTTTFIVSKVTDIYYLTDDFCKEFALQQGKRLTYRDNYTDNLWFYYECYWLLYPMKLVANLQGILYIIHPNDGKLRGNIEVEPEGVQLY